MSKHQFSGTGVALVTPFAANKTIDFFALERLVNHVIDNKVDYLVALGTTAESATMNSTEKTEVIEFIVKIANKRLPIVIGIGGNNLSEILATIRKTNFEGIDAILSVVPYYNKPTQGGLYQHYKAIQTQSPVPVILYNVPGRTGTNMTAETTLKLAHDFENIIAVKEASGNFEQIMKIVKQKPSHFAVLSGDDAITLPLISVGVVGVISVAANVIPAQFAEMVHLALGGKYEQARIIHYQIIDIIEKLFAEGNPIGAKAALTHLGILENYLRLPLTQASDQLQNELVEMLKS